MTLRDNSDALLRAGSIRGRVVAAGPVAFWGTRTSEGFFAAMALGLSNLMDETGLEPGPWGFAFLLLSPAAAAVAVAAVAVVGARAGAGAGASLLCVGVNVGNEGSITMAGIRETGGCSKSQPGYRGRLHHRIHRETETGTKRRETKGTGSRCSLNRLRGHCIASGMTTSSTAQTSLDLDEICRQPQTSSHIPYLFFHTVTKIRQCQIL